MRLEKRFFERRGGGVVKVPLPGLTYPGVGAGYDEQGIEAIKYVIDEHLTAYREEVASRKFVDIASCVSHLEGASIGAIKLSDWIIGWSEERRVALAASTRGRTNRCRRIAEIARTNATCLSGLWWGRFAVT